MFQTHIIIITIIIIAYISSNTSPKNTIWSENWSSILDVSGDPVPYGDIILIDLNPQFHSSWEVRVLSPFLWISVLKYFDPLNMICNLSTFIHGILFVNFF